MNKDMRPRKIPMWESFNDRPEKVGPLRLGRLDEIGEGDRKAAQLFIEALKGRRRALDVGCGAGLPGLYVAPRVGELVGVDAAPNMVAAAQQNAAELGLTNATFLVGGAEGLPFDDQHFDGASMLGVLESMDWHGVDRMMAEVRKVLKPNARLAILDRDWQHVLETEPPKSTRIRQDERRLMLQVVERLVQPALERDTRYLVDPNSASGRVLTKELGAATRAATTIEPTDIDQRDVIDAWYDEGAQFDEHTMAGVVGAYGYRDIAVQKVLVWNEPVLFLTASK